MYHAYWGLRRSPFRADPRAIAPTASQYEALARLGYLVEQGRACGALVGASGTGKSLLLALLGREARRAGRKFAGLSLLGREAGELVGQLALPLGVGLAAPDIDDAARAVAWRRIADAMTVVRHCGSGLVIACDDLDEAPAETLGELLRLAELMDQTQAAATLLLATTPSGIALLPPRLRERCELRVELAAWEAEETADFLLAALEAAGCRRTIFDASALLRIWELTDGNPRQIAQLAELALLAGAGREVAVLDEYLIDSVFEELRLPAVVPAF